MPQYHWKCTCCELEYTVYRRISERDEQPGAVSANTTDDSIERDQEQRDVGDCCHVKNGVHEWERILSSPVVSIPRHHRAAG